LGKLLSSASPFKGLKLESHSALHNARGDGAMGEAEIEDEDVIS